MKNFSLREIVEAEGRGRAGETDSVFFVVDLMAHSVRTIYRSARAKIISADSGLKKEGFEEMGLFADAQEIIAGIAELNAKKLRALKKTEEAFLNEMAAFLARHNAASAVGWSSKKKQNKMNRAVMEGLQKISRKKRDENWRFVHSKVFFGILENDKKFSGHIKMREWEKAVDGLFLDKSPDFPGRALRLARKFASGSRMPEAEKILKKAVSAQFGKEDQRREAEAYLKTFRKKQETTGS